MSVLLETSMGDIVIDLHVEQSPHCTLNFLKLCKVKYYNFCEFHRIEKNFIAQTGDPSGTGREGSSIYKLLGMPELQDEKVDSLTFAKRGTVAMSSGSQFFITLHDSLDSLQDRYVIIGQVAEGFEVLDKLNALLVDDSMRPFKDVRIKHTVILDDPFDDLKGMQVPDASPEPTPEMLKRVRLSEDEENANDEILSEKERMEREEKRLAEQRALTLELLGDLPCAEIKPPENVLFVCKLNPITRDKDLQLIFSRFGKIVHCEIVKDSEGKSLQYGFIEFEEEAACEEAYFKMNDVLIDDRRIKVDFSQSVAKLQMKERRRGQLGQSGQDATMEIKEKFMERFNSSDLIIEAERDGSEERRNYKRDHRDHRRDHRDHRDHRRDHRDHREHRRDHGDHRNSKRDHRDHRDSKRDHSDGDDRKRKFEQRKEKERSPNRR